MLTPLEIRKKEFRRRFRGYADQEVDAFLDQVVTAMEELIKESAELRDRLEQVEQNINRYREIEDTLKQTMVLAQKNAQELKQNTEKEAALMLQEARAEADRIVQEADQKAGKMLTEAEYRSGEMYHQAQRRADQLLEEYFQIGKRVRIFRTQFRAFLEANLQMLEDEEHGMAGEQWTVQVGKELEGRSGYEPEEQYQDAPGREDKDDQNENAEEGLIENGQRHVEV